MKTRVVTLYRDEWYPVYEVDTSPMAEGVRAEVPVSVLKRHAKALKEFRDAQKLLKAYHDLPPVLERN